MVAHGSIRVNGKKVDRPSFQVSLNDQITVKDKLQKLVRENLESLPGQGAPDWLSFDPSNLTATIISEPTPGPGAVRREHEPDRRVLSLIKTSTMEDPASIAGFLSLLSSVRAISASRGVSPRPR